MKQPSGLEPIGAGRMGGAGMPLATECELLLYPRAARDQRHYTNSLLWHRRVHRWVLLSCSEVRCSGKKRNRHAGVLMCSEDVRYCIEAGAEKEALAPDNREMKVLLRIHNWIWVFFCLILIESGRPLTEVMPTNSVLSTVAGRGEMHFGIPSCPKSRLMRTCQDLVTRSRFDSLHY